MVLQLSFESKIFSDDLVLINVGIDSIGIVKLLEKIEADRIRSNRLFRKHFDQKIPVFHCLLSSCFIFILKVDCLPISDLISSLLHFFSINSWGIIVINEIDSFVSPLDYKVGIMQSYLSLDPLISLFLCLMVYNKYYWFIFIYYIF